MAKFILAHNNARSLRFPFNRLLCRLCRLWRRGYAGVYCRTAAVVRRTPRKIHHPPIIQRHNPAPCLTPHRIRAPPRRGSSATSLKNEATLSQCVATHWESVATHWENVATHWENVATHWESVATHWESVATH